jgi:hypothetical protein
MAGTPLTNFSFVSYDEVGKRIIGIAGSRDRIYESKDGGDTWTLAADAHYPIRNVAVSRGRMLAVSDFNGVLAEAAASETRASGGN